MPKPNSFAVNSSLHPTTSLGVGYITIPASPGLLTQEDGVSFFVLETGAGDIALQ